MLDQVETCLSEAILTEIPHLRAYSRLMTDDVASADQQVTETLRRALSNIERLCKRTGLRVQLLRILRNFLIDSELAPRKFKGFGDLRAPQGAFSERQWWTWAKADEPRIRPSLP